MAEAWRGFKKDGHWDVDVNVRNFIQQTHNHILMPDYLADQIQA